MKHRFLTPGKIAHLTRDGKNLVVRSKYGTRFVPSGEDQIKAQHYLIKNGFKKELLWRCTCPTCTAVESHDPCVFARGEDPSGECLMHPKSLRPDLPHHLVTYEQI